MITILISWLASAAVIMVAGYVIPGVEIAGFNVAIVVALILGILNAFVRPVLTILTLPITILTLGLFLFVLNALMVWWTSLIVTGFDLTNFWSAIWMSLFISIVYSFFSILSSSRLAKQG